jgi:hypothetical protein
MEEAPENGKEPSHSAHASGMNEWMNEFTLVIFIWRTEQVFLVRTDVQVIVIHTLTFRIRAS